MIDNLSLESSFSKHIKTLCDRYDRALEKTNLDAIAIYSGSVKRQFLDDMDYPFKVNPHFKTWVPIENAPHCWIVYQASKKPVLIFYQSNDYWHQSPFLPQQDWILNEFELRIITSIAEAKNYIPGNVNNCGLIAEEPHKFSAWPFSQLNSEVLLNYVHYFRAYKTQYEQLCLKRANELAILGHQAAKDCFFDGGSEFDIHQAYCRAIRFTDNELPYSNIMALNEHGAILHYQCLDRLAPNSSKSLLIDAGASFNGYAADITRTYAYQNDQFEELITNLDCVQRELVAAVKPGLSFIDLHRLAHEKIAIILFELKLVTLEPEAIISNKITNYFFPHGLGHLIGLQVHDVGGHMKNDDGLLNSPPKDAPFLRCTRMLESTQAITIEPGIYFIDHLLKQLSHSDYSKYINWVVVDLYRSYGGIRIEDDIIVTNDTPINLTRNAMDNYD